MSLSVTVLGCAGSYAGPGNACSGYLVRSPEATVVVDLGSGTLANLQRHVSLDQLDALVVTHEHPDHWVDLPIFRNALKYYVGVEGLAVYGTDGVHRDAQGLIGRLEPTLRWTTLDAGSSVQIGDQRLRFSRTDHPVETLAVRVEAAGRTLAYTADTGSGWEPGDFLTGVDLLVCEATMPEEHQGRAQHLTGPQAGGLAQAAGVGKLVLTHVAPGVDPTTQHRGAATAFTGTIELAEVGASFVV